MPSGIQIPSPEQPLSHPLFTDNGIEVNIKRDDLIHPIISGNKFRKLHLHLEKAKSIYQSRLLTFGGAFSNHIAATAAAGKLFGVRTIGIIRGDELTELNPTLQRAADDGMQLEFYSRADYKLKHTQDFKEHAREIYGAVHIVAEGGADFLGVNGAMDIAKELQAEYDFVVVAAGTGTTSAALRIALPQNTKLITIPVLKNGSFLLDEIDRLQHMVTGEPMDRSNITLYDNYHFGGYAKANADLIQHARAFYDATGIKTDLVYTSKVTYALLDLIEREVIPRNSRVLFVHTGGLQGNIGMERKLGISLYS